MQTREVLRVLGAASGAATAVVALYVTFEEFLRREHVVMAHAFGVQNTLVLVAVWIVAATNRAWREWSE
jgi:hypothetical protein